MCCRRVETGLVADGRVALVIGGLSGQVVPVTLELQPEGDVVGLLVPHFFNFLSTCSKRKSKQDCIHTQSTALTRFLSVTKF